MPLFQSLGIGTWTAIMFFFLPFCAICIFQPNRRASCWWECVCVCLWSATGFWYRASTQSHDPTLSITDTWLLYLFLCDIVKTPGRKHSVLKAHTWVWAHVRLQDGSTRYRTTLNTQWCRVICPCACLQLRLIRRWNVFIQRQCSSFTKAFPLVIQVSQCVEVLFTKLSISISSTLLKHTHTERNRMKVREVSCDPRLFCWISFSRRKTHTHTIGVVEGRISCTSWKTFQWHSNLNQTRLFI